jgi:hypothetical protein
MNLSCEPSIFFNLLLVSSGARPAFFDINSDSYTTWFPSLTKIFPFSVKDRCLYIRKQDEKQIMNEISPFGTAQGNNVSSAFTAGQLGRNFTDDTWERTCFLRWIITSQQRKNNSFLSGKLPVCHVLFTEEISYPEKIDWQLVKKQLARFQAVLNQFGIVSYQLHCRILH